MLTSANSQTAAALRPPQTQQTLLQCSAQETTWCVTTQEHREREQAMVQTFIDTWTPHSNTWTRDIPEWLLIDLPVTSAQFVSLIILNASRSQMIQYFIRKKKH